MYSPKPLPVISNENRELKAAMDWIMEELQALAREAGETQELELRERNSEPEFPRKGMVVYADGTNWDPGDGEGQYYFDGTNWIIQRTGSEPNSYGTITDGTTPASADAPADTFKLRGSTGLAVVTQSNNVTHGDNALFSLVLSALGSAGIALDDKLPFADTSNSDANARSTPQVLLDLIGALSTESSPDFAADFLALYDASGAVAKKLVLSKLARPSTLLGSVATTSGASQGLSIPSGYSNLEIRLINVGWTNSVQPGLRFSENGGSSFLTNPGQVWSPNGNTAGSNLTVLSDSSMANTTLYNGRFNVRDYLSTTGKWMDGASFGLNLNRGFVHQRYIISTAAINYVELSVPAGTLSNGSMEAWGVP